MGISDLALGAPRYCFSTQDYNETKYSENKSKYIEEQIKNDNNEKEKQIKQAKICTYLSIKEKHLIDIANINHITFIPIKLAINKYITQIREINNFCYTQKFIIRNYNEILIIQKIKNKWMCSKEKLEFIDFDKVNIDE